MATKFYQWQVTCDQFNDYGEESPQVGYTLHSTPEAAIAAGITHVQEFLLGVDVGEDEIEVQDFDALMNEAGVKIKNDEHFDAAITYRELTVED